MATKYTLPEGQKLATFKVDENNWEAFKALCERSDLSASKALTNFIQSSLDAGELGAAAFAPVVESSQNIDIDIDALETRLLAKIRGELESQQPPTLDPDIEARLDAMEAALSGK
ncbi:hypothetical protein NO976_04430 (plasmid) [Planktothrix agardhii]|jgi:hypothetical protein|uniref:hypothetical protein n=1 Tax=Planktothrix agardhii TaxID=1160 RepID=UPI0020A71A3C|nr:hypothetical protein [Planktothrix agardhii]CAD5984489.1 hypothetical protein NO976_04430 [Planktothrix agardhii]